MLKSDLMELKKRIKGDDCSITRVCGCYVNAEKKKVTKLSETFLNLDDDVFFKYLDIVKKTLSGTVGNNFLEYKFPFDETIEDGMQKYLLRLKESKLKNEELLDILYDRVIDNYQFVGNYLILVFHDVYDVITKNNAHQGLDESEETYEYLLCSICPVELSKPGLGYREDENKMGARIRDWIVKPPESGFLYPSFTERSADIDSIVCFHKNPKSPHSEMEEELLGCKGKQTAAEKKHIFREVIESIVGDTNPDAFDLIQKEVSDTITCNEQSVSETATKELLTGIMESAGMSSNEIDTIVHDLDKAWEDTPSLDNLLDKKAASDGKIKRELKDLRTEIATLKNDSNEDVQKIIVSLPKELENTISKEEDESGKFIRISVNDLSEVIINTK